MGSYAEWRRATARKLSAISFIGAAALAVMGIIFFVSSMIWNTPPVAIGIIALLLHFTASAAAAVTGLADRGVPFAERLMRGHAFRGVIVSVFLMFCVLAITLASAVS